MEARIYGNANYIKVRAGIFKSIYALVDDHNGTGFNVLMNNGIYGKFFPELSWINDRRFVVRIFTISNKFSKVLENLIFPLIDNKLLNKYGENYNSILVQFVQSSIERS